MSSAGTQQEQRSSAVLTSVTSINYQRDLFSYSTVKLRHFHLQSIFKRQQVSTKVLHNIIK